jgi:hypothetical protein
MSRRCEPRLNWKGKGCFCYTYQVAYKVDLVDDAIFKGVPEAGIGHE